MSGATGPRAAAIVVNYNGGALLRDCIGALRAVPAVGEIIVVDNASSDGSVEAMLAALGPGGAVEVHQNGRNIGYGAAVNRALGRVTREFALIVNPDCVVGRRTPAVLIREMDQTADAAICGGLVLSSDGALQNATRRHYPSPGRALRRALRWPATWRSRLAATDFDRIADPLPPSAEDVDAVSGALMLARMEAVRQVGGFDEGYFLHCEDLDWSVRFRRAGWRVRFVPEGFAVHAKGASGGVRPWRIRWTMHRGMVRFYQKFEAPRRGVGFNLLIVMAIWARFALGVLAHPVRIRFHPLLPYPKLLHRVREVAARMERVQAPHTLVIGATSAVARYLLGDEQPEGWTLAVSRRAPSLRLEAGVIWMRSADGRNLPSWSRERLRQVIHLAPLWELPAYLDSLADIGIERVVACSSTSIVTHARSNGGSRFDVSSRLAEAEAAVQARCAARGIELVLLRPTLIYAPGGDRNLDRIASVAGGLGFFPLAGSGRGLRQPVHAEDVAQAIRASLGSPTAAGRCYDVSGGEVLTYREMVERVIRHAGRTPLIVPVPVRAYELALRATGWISGSLALDPGLAARMDEDHAFEHQEAARDLGYSPRAFLQS